LGNEPRLFLGSFFLKVKGEKIPSARLGAKREIQDSEAKIKEERRRCP